VGGDALRGCAIVAGRDLSGASSWQPPTPCHTAVRYACPLGILGVDLRRRVAIPRSQSRGQRFKPMTECIESSPLTASGDPAFCIARRALSSAPGPHPNGHSGACPPVFEAFWSRGNSAAASLLLANRPTDVTGVGHRVGYHSPSSAQPGYRRLFGAPPSLGAARMRGGAGPAAAAEVA